LFFFARSLSDPLLDGSRTQAKKNIELAAPTLFQTVFIFLTIVFVLSQAYLLWETLRATVPALLINYPTISWGFALIYLVAGIALAVVDLMTALGPVGSDQK
jgi:hypothetical protein